MTPDSCIWAQRAWPWMAWVVWLTSGCYEAPGSSGKSSVGGPGQTVVWASPTPASSELAYLTLTPSARTVPAALGMVTLSVRALDANGRGLPGQTPALRIIRGSATLGAFQGTTDGNGTFTTSLSSKAPGGVAVRATLGSWTRTGIVTFTRACSAVSFGSPLIVSGLPGSGSEYSVGDLNDDGSYDMCVSNANTVTTVLNNGFGTLAVARSASNGDPSMDGMAARMVDLTGDGLADVATGYYSGDSIGIWSGDGGGNITQWNNSAYSSNQGPVVGDIDGDGFNDIAASAYYAGLLVIGFGAKTSLAAQDVVFDLSSTGIFGTLTALGDVNKDGLTDLVVGNNNSAVSVVALLLNQGNRTFSQPQQVAIGAQMVLVKLADVNDDGADDLVGFSNTDSNVYVALSDGSGGFQSAVSYPGGNASAGLDVADFNGDGKPDILLGLAVGTSVLVYLNQGSGTYSSAPLQVTSGNPGPTVSAADFDGDGRIDIVTVAGSSTVMLMNTCH